MNDLTLDQWLESTTEKRSELLSYSKSPISTDPGSRQLDVSRALELGQDAGELLADADLYLSQEFAKAILDSSPMHNAQTAKIVAKGKVAELKRLRDGLSVLYGTIKDRRFSLLSVGRW